MIDMLYVRYSLTESEFELTYSRLDAYLKKYIPLKPLHKDNKEKRGVYITYALSKYGLQEIRLRKSQYNSFFIEVRLRPQLLINCCGYYKSTTLDEFKYAELVFDYIILDILNLPVPSIRKWKVRRIEAVADIEVDNALIPYYIQLFKKGHILEYFLENKYSRKYWNSKTNVYLMANKVTVNWYDRYNTLKAKEKKSKDEFIDYSETKNILRFETQVRKVNKPLMEVLNVNFLKTKVLDHYKLIVGKGDYHTINNAIALVLSSTSRPVGLIVMLRLIEETGSIPAAKEKYTQQVQERGKKSNPDDFSKKRILHDFNKKLQQIRRLNINPVTIPEQWGIPTLKNLHSLISEAFYTE
ncbi:hypothetical protein [Cohnella fermenti]|uniref:Uncharacterized protein n=1 Tax=Cohnella fermenti TaxID=2565925 RepID=A0A4S4BH68_9BACL|nr:hypothetical protein [Cohnella fermenti]THF73869.1 hypothetical protein E6C55_27555 [Cohnella fermenti]